MAISSRIIILAVLLLTQAPLWPIPVFEDRSDASRRFSRIVVSRYDAQGRGLGRREFALPASSIREVHSPCLLPGGGIAFFVIDEQRNESRIYALRSDGAVSWTRSVPFARKPGEWPVYPLQAMSLQNDTLCALGAMTFVALSQADGRVRVQGDWARINFGQGFKHSERDFRAHAGRDGLFGFYRGDTVERRQAFRVGPDGRIAWSGTGGFDANPVAKAGAGMMFLDYTESYKTTFPGSMVVRNTAGDGRVLWESEIGHFYKRSFWARKTRGYVSPRGAGGCLFNEWLIFNPLRVVPWRYSETIGRNLAAALEVMPDGTIVAAYHALTGDRELRQDQSRFVYQVDAAFLEALSADGKRLWKKRLGDSDRAQRVFVLGLPKGRVAVATSSDLFLLGRGGKTITAETFADAGRTIGLLGGEEGFVLAREVLADVEPIHWAAETGNADLVRFELKRGVSADLRNRDGLTPLHIAAQNGRVEVIRLLLGKGADRKASAGSSDTRPADLARQFKKSVPPDYCRSRKHDLVELSSEDADQATRDRMLRLLE